MNIKLQKASKQDLQILHDLSHLYIYDMSRYCGFLPDWKIPDSGVYHNLDFTSYFIEPDRYPFLLRIDEEIAGFVLINKIVSCEQSEWNMAEFFIQAKFQGKGIGKIVARKLFDQFPGQWEVQTIPENTKANIFWEEVICEYAEGKFEKTQKMVLEPKPHPMIVRCFNTASKSDIQNP